MSGSSRDNPAIQGGPTTAGPLTPAVVRARTLGCEIDGQVHDILLIGDGLYVVRLGPVERSRVDAAGLLKILHWAAVLYSRIGPGGLPSGHPDSSPDGTGARIARARMRLAAAPEARLLSLDPANLRAETWSVKARRTGADVVEIHGIFSTAADRAGARRTLRVDLAGDPVASLGRLLGLAGVALEPPAP